MYYLYILYSKSSDRYYIGHTNDPKRRLEEHNTSPFRTYTSKHRPWILEAAFPISKNRGETMRVERYLKKLKSRRVIEQLIKDQDSAKNISQSLMEMSNQALKNK